MTALFILLFWIAPAITAVLIGDRKGYKWQGLAAGVFLSWLGVIAVALWKPRPAAPPAGDPPPPAEVREPR
jgi:hypothetical protein